MPEKPTKTHHVTYGDINDWIGLSAGANHTVRLRQLENTNPACFIPAAVFAFDQSFPGPGIFEHLRLVEQQAKLQPQSKLMLFGHADKQGKDEYNKHLSDRRAAAVWALLVHDHQTFEKIAQEEDWPSSCYQAMLRGVGCNPGPIDGDLGSLTKAAVTWFQQEYNEDVFHDNDKRQHPDLIVDGLLGPKTMAALRDAYLACCPARIPTSRFMETPWAGCSEFNPVSSDDADNRRVIAAFMTDPTSLEAEIPCRVGNIKACQVDDQAQMRCKYYRLHVHETEESEDVARFSDYQWLPGKDRTIYLSVLTSLPDDTSVDFTIAKFGGDPAELPTDHTQGSRPNLGDQLGTTSGKVKHGVCTAKWTHPEDYDPMDFECWFDEVEVEIELPDEDEDDIEPTGKETIDSIADSSIVNPPVFLVESANYWGLSEPPSERLDRIHVESETSVDGLGFLADGRAVIFGTSQGDIDSEPNSVVAIALNEMIADTESFTDSAEKEA